jgi:hypothetical protein
MTRYTVYALHAYKVGQGPHTYLPQLVGTIVFLAAGGITEVYALYMKDGEDLTVSTPWVILFVVVLKIARR